MTVKIDYDIFAARHTQEQVLDLLFLLNIVTYKDRYRLLISDEGILETDSYRLLPSAIQSVIDETLSYTIMSSKSEGNCCVREAGDQEYVKAIFSLEESIRYLLQPLSIIVENSLNDSHLLIAAFRSFDQMGKLMEWYKNGWIQFENAGGCGNIMNFIKSRIQLFGWKTKFLHCYVILDSDKRFPSDVGSNTEKLQAQLRNWNVPFHRFKKRAMENYLPLEAMEKVLGNPANKAWIQAYKYLSEEQKDYFCIAGGFIKDLSKDDRKKLENEKNGRKYKKVKKKPVLIRKYMMPKVQSFYSDVSDGNMEYLETGLSVSGPFKDTYPLAFDNPAYVNRNTFELRNCNEELQQINDEILKLL